MIQATSDYEKDVPELFKNSVDDSQCLDSVSPTISTLNIRTLELDSFASLFWVLITNVCLIRHIFKKVFCRAFEKLLC